MISRDTKVFIVVIAQGTRQWLTKHGSQRNERTGRIVIWPEWSTEPSAAIPTRFEMALIFRESYERDHGLKVHFTLRRADDEPFVEEPIATPTPDDRVPMVYRGLLVVPGMNRDERCWFVRFPQTDFESFRGSSPEEAVDKVYERPDLLPFAEKAPAPVAVVEEVQKTAPEFKVRPGSRY